MSAEAAVLPGFRDMAGDRVHAKVYEMTQYYAKANRDILVAGAGEGALEQRLIDGGVPPARIKAIDIEPQYHKVGAVGCQAADLNQRIPFPDASFNLVYALEVIEHLHNPKQLIREAWRVLTPGNGYFVISTPNAQSLIQRLRYFFTGRMMWFSEEDYLGSGHLHPIFDWILERMYRGMFEFVRYDSQCYKFGPLPMPIKSRLFAVNDIWVLRKLQTP